MPQLDVGPLKEVAERSQGIQELMLAELRSLNQRLGQSKSPGRPRTEADARYRED